MAAPPWHENYEQHHKEVQELQEKYHERCDKLGVSWLDLQEEDWRSLIARIVHESNWQEDLYLSPDRTKELADAAFNDPINIHGPHLDMAAIIQTHKQKVLELRHRNAGTEEIAAYKASRQNNLPQLVLLQCS